MSNKQQQRHYSQIFQKHSTLSIVFYHRSYPKQKYSLNHHAVMEGRSAIRKVICALIDISSAQKKCV